MRRWEDVGTTNDDECYMTTSGPFSLFVYDKGGNNGWGWDLSMDEKSIQNAGRPYKSRATAQRAGLRALSKAVAERISQALQKAETQATQEQNRMAQIAIAHPRGWRDEAAARRFKTRVAFILGLDADRVAGVVLDAPANDMVQITVTMVATPEQVMQFGDELLSYSWLLSAAPTE